ATGCSDTRHRSRGRGRVAARPPPRRSGPRRFRRPPAAIRVTARHAGPDARTRPPADRRRPSESRPPRYIAVARVYDVDVPLLLHEQLVSVSVMLLLLTMYMHAPFDAPMPAVIAAAQSRLTAVPPDEHVIMPEHIGVPESVIVSAVEVQVMPV